MSTYIWYDTHTRIPPDVYYFTININTIVRTVVLLAATLSLLHMSSVTIWSAPLGCLEALKVSYQVCVWIASVVYTRYFACLYSCLRNNKVRYNNSSMIPGFDITYSYQVDYTLKVVYSNCSSSGVFICLFTGVTCGLWRHDGTSSCYVHTCIS